VKLVRDVGCENGTNRLGWVLGVNSDGEAGRERGRREFEDGTVGGIEMGPNCPWSTKHYAKRVR
jgi:hypothetical protein